MALKPCPSCNKEIAKSATSCPHCGKAFTSPLAKLGGCLIGGVVLFVVILMAASMCNG